MGGVRKIRLIGLIRFKKFNIQETEILIFSLATQKNKWAALPWNRGFWKCMNIELCRHIKLARILSRGVRFFGEITPHPSAPLNSPQGVSGGTLIGLIYIWANKQLVPWGAFLCSVFLRTSQESKALISTAAMWNNIRHSWKCKFHICRHQEGDLRELPCQRRDAQSNQIPGAAKINKKSHS